MNMSIIICISHPVVPFRQIHSSTWNMEQGKRKRKDRAFTNIGFL